MTAQKPARRTKASTTPKTSTPARASRPSAARQSSRRTGGAAATRRTTRRTSTRGTSPRRTTTSRRRQPKLATTVGAALATLLVTTFTSLSWPARLGILALVVLAGLAWMLWSHRAEIRAGAAAESASTGEATDLDPEPTPSTDPLQEPSP